MLNGILSIPLPVSKMSDDSPSRRWMVPCRPVTKVVAAPASMRPKAM